MCVRLEIYHRVPEGLRMQGITEFSLDRSRVRYCRSFRAMSSLVLNVSKDWSSTTSSGNQLWWQSSTCFNISCTATAILCSQVDGQGNGSASLLPLQ